MHSDFRYGFFVCLWTMQGAVGDESDGEHDDIAVPPIAESDAEHDDIAVHVTTVTQSDAEPEPHVAADDSEEFNLRARKRLVEIKLRIVKLISFDENNPTHVEMLSRAGIVTLKLLRVELNELPDQVFESELEGFALDVLAEVYDQMP